ncbi:MAG TPA: cupin domain-containing protein [Chitinophagaceae bacterium]|nr:cupin domain-containing protein [Chitinophagaceae bacterium]
MSFHITIHEAEEILTQKAPLPFVKLLGHGTMSIEYYAPVGDDRQTPHKQDELYIIARGKGIFYHDGERVPFGERDVLFVPAGMEHRFEDFAEGFATWVIFYGNEGGEDETR